MKAHYSGTKLKSEIDKIRLFDEATHTLYGDSLSVSG